MKRIIAVLMSIFILLSTAVPVTAVELSDDIVVLYTNDIHTYIDGELSYDVLAAIKKDLENEYKNVILVDAGDHVQGTAYGSMDKGESMIKLMNAAGYDVATLGNHEFDYGMERCMELVALAEFEYVTANFYHEAEGVRGENVLDPYPLIACGDEKVAFVGITTPETFYTSTPKYFQNENGEFIYGISSGEDGSELRADVQAAVDGAISDGATVVIALGHMGVDDFMEPYRSTDTIGGVSGLDAFIDGHSHTVMEGELVKDKDGEDVVLTQTGEYFERIGMMIIDSETHEIVTDFIELEEILSDDGESVEGYKISSELYKRTELISDENTKSLKDAWMSEIEARLGVKIGSAEITFDNYDADGNRLVRFQETNTGDFAADALYFLFDDMGLDVDVAIMNGGGVRNLALTGDISYQSCKLVHPFGNVACLQTVTGQQILDALEWGARFVGEGENGGFLQVSGLTYKIDTSIPNTVKQDDMMVWVGAPDRYRVHDVMIYDKETDSWNPLDTSANYNLAGYNYTLRDLGDGYAMFDGSVNVLDYVMEDYMVFANYVSAFDGSIKAKNSPLLEKYPSLIIDYGSVNGSGRIAAVNSSEDASVIIGAADNVWISKHGNVFTNCPVKDFLGEMGYAVGDTVKVKFLDKELILPVVPTYAYVDSGTAAVIVGIEGEDREGRMVSLAVNMASFAELYGLAEKSVDENGDAVWKAPDGVSYPVKIEFELVEKGGYLGEVILRELVSSNNREDYPHLSDEEYANFRKIATTGIRDGVLYRASSPLNDEYTRTIEAMAAIEKAGVTVIMNFADSKDEAQAYETMADSYYAGCKVIYLDLTVDVLGDAFREGFADGLRFFAENKGVYAIHCTQGKDRAGFAAAVLSCLMGATYDEVVDDYMLSYYNYYGVEKGSDKYNAIAKSNIVAILCDAFEVEDLTSADLSLEAEEYILGLGLTASEISALKANLSIPKSIGVFDSVEDDNALDDDPPVDTSDNDNTLKIVLAVVCAVVIVVDGAALLWFAVKKKKMENGDS